MMRILIPILLLCAVAGIYSSNESNGTSTPCDKLPRPYIDAEMIISNSPFTPMFCSWDIFACSSIVFTKPQTGEIGYNLTAYMFSKLQAAKFECTLYNNSVFDSILCNTGMRLNYVTIFVDFCEENKAFCVAACDPDNSTRYKYTVCSGKTERDREMIINFMEEHSIPGMMDVQAGCNNACIER